MKHLIKIDKKRQIKRAIFLGLVIIWMMVIFAFSNQPSDESSKTSSTIATVVASFLTNIKAINIEQKANLIIILNPIIRKLAHFFIYTVGGFLIINYVNTYKITDQREILYSIILGAIYATSDEIHQLFIEGRAAQVTDVILDTIGVATGVCIFLCIQKIVNKVKNRNINGGEK